MALEVAREEIPENWREPGELIDVLYETPSGRLAWLKLLSLMNDVKPINPITGAFVEGFPGQVYSVLSPIGEGRLNNFHLSPSSLEGGKLTYSIRLGSDKHHTEVDYYLPI